MNHQNRLLSRRGLTQRTIPWMISLKQNVTAGKTNHSENNQTGDHLQGWQEWDGRGVKGHEMDEDGPFDRIMEMLYYLLSSGFHGWVHLLELTEWVHSRWMYFYYTSVWRNWCKTFTSVSLPGILNASYPHQNDGRKEVLTAKRSARSQAAMA